MDDSLNKLIQIETPPISPVAPGTPDRWLEVESQLRLEMPQHYKDYLRVYGAGQWADFFGVMNPFYEWRHPQAKGYFRWIDRRLEHLDDFRKQFPQDTAPFCRYPGPGGLIPFGYDDNGGTLCFQVAGDAGSWPIVFLDGKLSERCDVFRGAVADFISALLREEFLPKTWPSDVFPIKKPAFRPYTNE